MTSFFKFLLIFTILVIYSERCACKPSGAPEGKGALLLVEKLCVNSTAGFVRSRILLCFICKGLDPSCLPTITTSTARPGSSSSPAASSVTPNVPTTPGE